MNVSGLWRINQSNGGGADVTISPENPFTLTASQTSADVRGDGSGFVNGDEITLRIRWTNGTEGAYHGVLNQQGVFQGTTFDVRHPSSSATWTSSKSFQ